MRPLTVIGTGPGAPAADALAALPGGVRGLALAPAATGGADASPLVAARHAGTLLDPPALLAEAREAEVAGLDGGPLAPLTPRYTVRDLARELGRPVAVAVAAGGRLTGEALGALDALRGAGLTVAGVLLAGWPEPPGRILLDERALLAELAGLPVAPVAPGLPELAGWTGARTEAGVPAAGAAARVALEPYRPWAGTAPGDPRDTPRPRIMEVLVDIVAEEGPVLATRAYAAYNRAAGGRKLTSVARAPLSSAAYWLAREERLVLRRAEDAPGQEDDVLRLPDAPAVRVRELGPRALEEVPLDEVAELVRRLRATGRGRGPDEARAKRAVLDAYGLRRLTSRADEYLARALRLADGDDV